MKPFLGLLMFGSGLVAQSAHYDQGILVSQVEGRWRYTGGIAHREWQLQFMDAGGRTWRFEPPAQLGQHGGYVEAIGRWKGDTYALAVLSHPLFTRLWDAWNPQDQTNRRDYLPRVLFRSRDGLRWERVASHQRDPYCTFGSFLPLEDGRFLVDRAIRLFEQDGASSPFAIYRVDGQGRLVQDALVPVDPQSRGWAIARAEGGIVLAQRRTGRWLLLSNQDGRILRVGDLWPRRAGLDQPATTRNILHAAPRPDGGILLATEDLPVGRPLHPAQRLHAFKNSRRLGPGERLVVERLQGDLHDSPTSPVQVHWWLLDPKNGVVRELAPPGHAPVLGTTLAQITFRFTVLPSGDLTFGLGMPSSLPPGRGGRTWSLFPLGAVQRLLMPRPKQAPR